jgi:hypothetical protein
VKRRDGLRIITRFDTWSHCLETCEAPAQKDIVILRLAAVLFCIVIDIFVMVNTGQFLADEALSIWFQVVTLNWMQDENRFSSKGAHLNLKRAERARAAINKLPALVESLTLRTRAWEEENGIPFLFDGVRLLAMLDEYNFLRQEKDEEKRRLRDHKKIQEQMMNEKQTLFALKPSPLKVPLSSKKVNGVSHTSVGGNGPQPNRRLSPGSAIPQPGTTKPSGTNGLNVSQQRK